jgi:hypothetical protein
MGGVATVTTVVFFFEIKVSFAVDDYVTAGGFGEFVHRAAVSVEFSVVSVHSVVGEVVVELSFGVVGADEGVGEGFGEFGGELGGPGFGGRV